MTARVTFVIPAYNAAATIAATLASVQAQTCGDWAAIVVDDGSVDATPGIVEDFAKQDNRINLIQSEHGGVCRARNAGIAAATSEWLAFLDADDRIDATWVEKMLAASGEADLVNCGYRRETPAGDFIGDSFDPQVGKRGFEQIAAYCPFAIHTVLVRRDLVDRAGRFDPAMATCEDWDLWLRVFRTGPRIASVPEILAAYVNAPGTLSTDMAGMLRDGIVVLLNGRASDPRVSDPDPRFADGVDPQGLGVALANFTAWWTGAAAGAGRAPEAMLDAGAPVDISSLDLWRLGSSIQSGIATGLQVSNAQIVADPAAFLGALQALVQALVARHASPRLAEKLQKYVMLRMFGRRRPDLGRNLGDMVALVWLKGRWAATVFVHAAFKRFGLSRYAVLARLAFWQLLGSLLLVECARTVSGFARMGRLRGPPAVLRLRMAVRRAASCARNVGRAPVGGLRLFSRAARLLRGKFSRSIVRGDVSSTGASHWEEVFAAPDPWKYASDYEQKKYLRTLDLIGSEPVDRALEIACAEGHFTAQIAPRVRSLIAADISSTALLRAEERCAGADNVAFRRLDLARDVLPDGQDLITCSEVLYYFDGEAELGKIAKKLRDALNPGGRLVMANFFLLKDDMASTGFDFSQAYGGKVIHGVFAQTPGLALEHSLLTDLYRIDSFRRIEAGQEPPEPLIEHEPLDCELTPELQREIVWGGAVARREEVRSEIAWSVPVLTYHRVSDRPAPNLAQWCISPTDFAAQTRLLRAHGFRAVTSRDLLTARDRQSPMRGRPVMITFDDAYRDTADIAWPILQAHGFAAEVFVPTDLIGGVAQWDAHLGPAAPLMDWDAIVRLHGEGMQFGSHLATHSVASSLSARDLLDEAMRSRAELERRLQSPVPSIAAPYGAIDERFTQICRLAGYRIGYSCEQAAADLFDPAFHLPRIEVSSSWTLDQFAAALQLKHSSTPA